MLHCSKLSDKVCSSCLSPQQNILYQCCPAPVLPYLSSTSTWVTDLSASVSQEVQWLNQGATIYIL